MRQRRPRFVGKDGVHLLLPAHVPRAAHSSRTFAGARPKRLVLEVRQHQVVQGKLGSAHFARLEGTSPQDPVMLDADRDLLGANERSVWPPHVDVMQRSPGPMGRHHQLERLAPLAVHLYSGRLRPPLGGRDALVGVTYYIFQPKLVLRSDRSLDLSLVGAGKAA